MGSGSEGACVGGVGFAGVGTSLGAGTASWAASSIAVAHAVFGAVGCTLIVRFAAPRRRVRARHPYTV